VNMKTSLPDSKIFLLLVKLPYWTSVNRCQLINCICLKDNVPYDLYFLSQTIQSTATLCSNPATKRVCNSGSYLYDSFMLGLLHQIVIQKVSVIMEVDCIVLFVI